MEDPAVEENGQLYLKEQYNLSAFVVANRIYAAHRTRSQIYNCFVVLLLTLLAF